MTSTDAHSFLDTAWLGRPSTEVAPDLIGCTLVRQFPDRTLYRGTIVETEAYAPDDPACHAYRRRTARNEVMFGPPGACYVYLIYGMYHCINVVTDLDTVPSAVLIRALDLESIPPWVDEKQRKKRDRVAAGPGKLCRALKIDRTLNGIQLEPGQPLWLEPRSASTQQAIAKGTLKMVQTTRIGLTQGADLPWRWYVKGCSAVSKKG
ncbi:DNA-3-methyladenine glycosylase [Oscillatoria sp. CS-180]|uniref:DNA-3-methyladenine glycosylase n=1 Tax=Oscillatoria sp. CS-180 TaxID=3021720 RepID=UPI00232E2EE4|nr:DNA-3-methyladenine glycosylase [Oscillatoria sp. CS-180]MDB9526731.1 DNA-3-methyladenine glycosylase [Oscillatoria sp. CS-180]